MSRLEPVPPRNGSGGGYLVHTRGGDTYRCRGLIVAPGRTPYVPDPFRAVLGAGVVHLVDYLDAVTERAAARPSLRVAVVGGSQSAVEIMLHLTATYPEAEVVGITHNFGYRLKDTSPFTGEVYFPSFVDRYYRADEETKLSLRRELWFTNYSAADRDVLDALYRTRYQQRIQGRQRLEVLNRSRVVAAREGADGIELELAGDGDGAPAPERFDLVVLATGFCNIGVEENQQRTHPLLDGLSDVKSSSTSTAASRSASNPCAARRRASSTDCASRPTAWATPGRSACWRSARRRSSSRPPSASPARRFPRAGELRGPPARESAPGRVGGGGGDRAPARAGGGRGGGRVERPAPELPSRGRSVPLVQFEAPGLGLALPVVDPDRGTYLRPLPGYGFYGGGKHAVDVEDPDAVPPLGDEGVRDCCERVARLLDPDAGFQAANAIHGFDAYTPDLRPRVGFLPQRRGLYAATGFSGRGYKVCLAVGLGVAREIAPRPGDAASDVDLSPFRPGAAA